MTALPDPRYPEHCDVCEKCDEPEHCRGYGDGAKALLARGAFFPCPAPEAPEDCTCACRRCNQPRCIETGEHRACRRHE
jgi:hypothetical protein